MAAAEIGSAVPGVKTKAAFKLAVFVLETGANRVRRYPDE
jgi:hypothetical protein